MSNELDQVRIVPQSPQLGATVLGIDAKEPIDDGVVQLLRAAVLRYKVIFFPEQNLTGEQQSAFGNHFDQPYETNIRARGQGLTNLTIVPHFHSDNMYHEVQPAFAILQMLELPDVGGDTMWADLVSSYAALSQPLRDMIDPLTAIHGHPDYGLDDAALAERYGEKAGETLTPDDIAEIREALRPHEHPLVRIIPETGLKSYWLGPFHTTAIKGLPKDESDALLQLLFKQQLKPEFVIRWRWSVGDLAFWDHRTTLHCGVNDYGDQKRRGQRVNLGLAEPIRALPGVEHRPDKVPSVL